MQYTQLKQVIDIEYRITTLHKELSDLYAKRTLFVGTSGLANLVTKDTPNSMSNIKQALDDPWVIQTYAYLANAWAVHDIIIPRITIIDKKLLKARKIIDELTIALPELGSQMGVLLVPPISILPFPTTKEMRYRQAHVVLTDYVNPELVTTKGHKKNWQVLVAYMGMTGLDFGGAAKIMQYKKYIINGNDTRAMGIRQYTALSFQVNQPIDQHVWTVLLDHEFVDTKLVPSVTFLKNQFRFELDEPNSILGDERFRPAVEVTG